MKFRVQIIFSEPPAIYPRKRNQNSASDVVKASRWTALLSYVGLDLRTVYRFQN